MSKLRAKFFKDVDGKRDLVEVTIIGDPCTVIQKVSPVHVQQFPMEWEAYQAGQTEIEVKGTPLTEVPGIDRGAALGLKLKGVRTAEELAALDEAAAKALGMGVITWRKSADNLIRLRRLEAMDAALNHADDAEDAPKRRGRPPKAATEEAA